jgi:hypothetical protein
MSNRNKNRLNLTIPPGNAQNIEAHVPFKNLQASDQNQTNELLMTTEKPPK